MVRSDLQVQNGPKYLEIIKNHYFSEKSLDIWVHLKNNLWNNRIPSDFDYVTVKFLSCRDQPVFLHGRLADWFPVGLGTPSWSSCGHLKQVLVFCILFRNCCKVITCWPMSGQCSLLVLPKGRKFSEVLRGHWLNMGSCVLYFSFSRIRSVLYSFSFLSYVKYFVFIRE